VSNEHFNMFIDEKTVTAINASNKGLLTVPTEEQNDTLYVKSDTEKKWRELVEVRDTKCGPSPEGTHTIFTVQYRMHDDGYPQPNRGRIMTKSYWVNPAALKDAGHDEHKKSRMNMGKMLQLMKACEVELVKSVDPETGEEGYDMKSLFNGIDGDKPMVGKVFWGIIRDYVYQSRREGVGLVNDQDIDRFIKNDKA
jgi:hypothetical protein